MEALIKNILNNRGKNTILKVTIIEKYYWFQRCEKEKQHNELKTKADLQCVIGICLIMVGLCLLRV